MRAPTLLLALSLALLPACMQTKENVEIQKSGKGSITLKTVVDKQMTEALVEMMQGMGWGQGMGADPTAQLDPERIKKSLAGKKGIEVRSATRTVDEETGKITVDLDVAFDSLEDLYSSGAVLGVGAKLERLEDGNYRFTRSVFADQLPKEGDLESQQMLEGILMMIQPYMEGMRFEAELTLPTDVVETSGEKLDGRHVRWSIAFEDLLKPAKRTQTVVFSGAGLDWKPFEAKAANPLERRKPSVPTGPVTPSDDGGKEQPAPEPEPEPEPEPKPGGDGAR